MRTYVAPLFLSLVLALAGCSDDDDSVTPDSKVTPKDGGTGDKAVTPDQGPPADQGPPPDAPVSAQICGYLETTQGSKLSGAPVLACNHYECNTDTTGTTGSFCVLLTRAERYVFHVTENKAGGKHYADVMFPFTVTAADLAAQKKYDVGKVIVPTIDKTVELTDKTSGTLDLGGGVKLTVEAGDTKLPALVTKGNAGAVVVGASLQHDWLKKAVPAGGTLAGAVAVVPVGVTFTKGATLEVPVTGVADSTTLTAYWIDPDDGQVLDKGELTVSGGVAKSVSGKGLKALGWLMLVKK